MLDIVAPSTVLRDLRLGSAVDRSRFAGLVAARADILSQAGVARGNRVAMCHGGGLPLLVDLFAAWRLGAAAAVLSPSLVEVERRRMAERLRPTCWIGSPVEGALSLDPASPDQSDSPRDTAWTDACAPDDAALILMTSGTTGEPKGVVLTHRALLARVSLNAAHIGADGLARSLTLLPLHFGHGLIGNVLTPMFAGSVLNLFPEPGLDGLSRLGAIVDAEAVTFMSSVPSMWRVALRVSPPPTKRTLRRIHVGSEQLSEELWREIASWAQIDNVFNMYGITEAANWIAGERGVDSAHLAGSVGRPWGGAVRVIDEQGALRASGRGEVCVSTPSLMTGYLDDPSATSAAIGGGWLRTGDIGEIDAQGRLRIVGRLKHQINRAGIKVAAEEIDLLLQSHPDVLEACAFALPDAVSGEVVGAAVVAKAGREIDPQALAAWCEGRVRREAVPARISVLRELPRTERGKVKRDAVRDAAFGGKAAHEDLEARKSGEARDRAVHAAKHVSA